MHQQKSIEDQVHDNIFRDPEKIKLIKQLILKVDQIMSNAKPGKILLSTGFDTKAYACVLAGITKEKWNNIVDKVSKDAGSCDAQHAQDCLNAHKDFLAMLPYLKRLVGLRSNESDAGSRGDLLFKQYQNFITDEDTKEKLNKQYEQWKKWENASGTLRKQRSLLTKALAEIAGEDEAKKKEHADALAVLKKHILNLQENKDTEPGVSSTSILSAILEINPKAVSNIQKLEDSLKTQGTAGSEGFKEFYKILNQIKKFLKELSKEAEDVKYLITKIHTAYMKQIMLVRRSMFGLSSRMLFSSADSNNSKN